MSAPAQMLEAFADAWNRHDIDALMSFMSEDCVFESSAGPDVWGTRYAGREAVRAGFVEVLSFQVWRGDGKMGKLELKIKVICEELPGTALLGSPASGVEVGRREIYLGIQHGDEMIEAAPATKKRIVFEPGFRVLPMPGDKANFLGPFAKGTPAQRFFYLSWAVKDGGGGLTIIGRTKVHLSHLRWSEIEESLETGKPLTVTLRLTDQRGRPRYASIRGEEASWQG